MALNLSFQREKPKLVLSGAEVRTPIDEIEGARDLFDITRSIYEERIKPAFDNFIAGPKERFGAVRESIEQKSFAPLAQSFKEYAERSARELSTIEGITNLALGFTGGGIGSVRKVLPKKVTPKQVKEIRETILKSEESVPHIAGVEEKLGSPIRGFESNKFETNPNLMGTISRGEITDSFVLIRDKQVADQFLEEFIKKANKKTEQKLTKIGTPKEDIANVLIAERKQILEKTQDIKNAPDTASLYPKEIAPEIAEFQGYKKTSSGILAFLSDGKNQVALDVDKVAFVRKQLPEAQFRINPAEESLPVQITVGNELKGLIMPIRGVEDFPFRITDLPAPITPEGVSARGEVQPVRALPEVQVEPKKPISIDETKIAPLPEPPVRPSFGKPLPESKALPDDIISKDGLQAEKLKERTFYKSIEESPNTTPELKQVIKELPQEEKLYGRITDKSSLERAQEFIRTQGEDSALSSVLRTEKMSKDLSVMGQELMRRYQQTGRMNLAVDVAHTLAQKATEGGQVVQSFAILNRLSPEGVLLYASRRTGQKLSPQFAEKITAQAKKIEELPYSYEKFKETHKLTEMIVREAPISKAEIARDWFLELANLPRTVMSSFFDFSFGLRQGIVTLYSHPKEFGRAFKSQFKPFASEQAYDDLMDTIIKHPEFELAQRYGVGFTDINLKLGAREERFMSSLAEKIPLLGIPIRATNRAYTAMANKIRIDTFSTMIKNAERTGMNVRENGKVLRDTAKLVNDITGRGELTGVFQKANELLNAFFYSPRLMASRINLLNPTTYIGLNPQTRKEALRAMFAMASGTTTILYLASLIPGAEVGVDPRSADFGKIKIGNTRVDIMGGFQQWIRIGAQLQSGKYVSSTTGKVITLGEGYRPMTRLEVLVKGLESKEAPIFSFASALMKGQDFEGNKISVPKEIGKRFVPMLMSDVYELAQEDPELLPLGFLGIFGVGLQSYAPPEAYIKLNEINNSPDPAAAYDQLKAENPILATKVKKAKKEENFTEFDWMLTGMKVNNGDRARFLIERFNSLKTKEEKAELYDDLREKKIISDTVAEQIKNLLEAQQ